MASPSEIVQKRKEEIEKEIESAKAKYSKIIFNYARRNPTYARTLREYGLDYIHRIKKPANTFDSDNALIYQIEKELELSKVAINLHDKATAELNKDKDFRFRESLKQFDELKKGYLETFTSANSYLVNFQSLISKKKTIPECLLEETLIEQRINMRNMQLDLGRIYMDIFEGTTIMSGKIPEHTEEEMEEEAI